MEATGRHCKQLCGGMEIPCRLVFICLSKAKINRLKELLENSQTAPLGATTHEKVDEQRQHMLSFFYVYFLTS